LIGLMMVAKREEAAGWFAVLRRGVITHDECKTYDRWRRDPENRAAMQALQELWLELEMVRDHVPQIGASGSSQPGKIAGVARSVRAAAFLSVAASLVLAMMIDLDSAWWTSLDWWSR
jgi:ferric-dicitrate binding protein FerR (iron transport regulator)